MLKLHCPVLVPSIVNELLVDNWRANEKRLDSYLWGGEPELPVEEAMKARAVNERKSSETILPLIDKIFEEKAQRHADIAALRCGTQTMTYRALDDLSNRVAAAVHYRLKKSGEIVGLRFDRSLEYVVAMLGVLKSGNACLPLPTDYPKARLAEVLALTNPALVIDAEDSNAGPGALRYSDAVKVAGSRAISVSDGTDRLAFVLSSSGSTGVPKMIKRTHLSLMPRMEWAWAHFPYAKGEISCQKSYMATSHSIYEFLEPLLAGGTVTIVPERSVKNLVEFWTIVKKEGFRRLLLVPSMVRASLSNGELQMPELDLVIFMGESITEPFAKLALSRFKPTTQLWSVYGTTEGGSFLVYDLRALERGQPLTLGVPIGERVKQHILNESGQEVRIGEEGVLHIEGCTVSGYLGNIAQTAELSRRDPRTGQIIYNTQDLVKKAPDGLAQYIGRTDHVVKVRGFRVDLGDVESAISSYPGVNQACVVLAQDFSGSDCLVAFVAASSANTDQIKNHLEKKLPAYMVPAHIRMMQTLPLTKGGKLDRVTLKESFEKPVQASEQNPSSPRDAVISCFRTFFPGAEIDVESNFFDLGGNSLNVFQAIALLREKLKINDIKPAVLYAHPTVGGLLSYLERGANAEVSASIVVELKKAKSANSEPPLFLFPPSGGTTAPYEVLVRKLELNRPICGLRDPFLFGGRSQNQGFQQWLDLYVQAIIDRQPSGPLYLCGFSSSSTFVFEATLKLSELGREIAQVILIDPIVMGFAIKGSRGREASMALMGGSRLLKMRFLFKDWFGSSKPLPEKRVPFDRRFEPEQLAQLIKSSKSDPRLIWNYGLTVEVDTGKQVWPSQISLDTSDAESLWKMFKERTAEIFPGSDFGYFESAFVQYFCLQNQIAHLHYQPTGVLERATVYEVLRSPRSMLYHFFRPFIRELRHFSFPIDKNSHAVQTASRSKGPPSDSKLAKQLDFGLHMASLRDPRFVEEVARDMNALLSGR